MKRLNKIALLASLALGSALSAQAQNYEDVLRYSQKYYQGTARSMGSGNAFGALGADYTAIDINPAGLGLYRRPEFSLSLDLNHQKASADYLGQETVNGKYNLNMSNLGLVIPSLKTKMGKPVTDGWVSVNCAFGFQRINNFHSSITLSGINDQSTILDYFKQSATGHKPYEDEFSYGSLAYQAALLDPTNADSTEYRTLASYETNFKRVMQEDNIYTQGAMNHINFAVAGNYANKLYIGANVQLPTISYTYHRSFYETNLAKPDSIKYYQASTMQENLTTKGFGITATFGFIYRLSDQLRAGASVQLPTFMSLNDEYSYSVNATIKNYGKTDDYVSPTGVWEYTIVTPMHATASLAYIFGKRGFLSADYEYVDYSSGFINTEFDGVRGKNQAIATTLRPTGNLRIGGEIRSDNVSLRAGYAYYGSPYEKDKVPAGYNDMNRMLSFGLGIRDNNYFLDLGYQNQLNKFFYLPYALNDTDVDGGYVNNYRSSFIVTLGTKF